MSTLDEIINPVALHRPAPFWSWNDKLSEPELRRQLREMADKGWGSVFMHSRVGLVTGYLSDEWFALTNASCEEAKKLGLKAWLYDEDKWPSGFAGSLVPLKDESYRARMLVLRRPADKVSGDQTLTRVEHGGVEYDICVHTAQLGDRWFNGASWVDLMNPAAVRFFLETTHEQYKKNCGKYFGTVIPGIFTDEPCYIFRSSNWRRWIMTPWSTVLPDFFRKMHGYGIEDKLPLLFFNVQGYRKVRCDYYKAATELFKMSFTKQYHDWCEASNLKMTGHFMAEDSLVYQTQWSGDVMSHYEFMHWPGIDLLGRFTEFDRHYDHLVPIKQVCSAAAQLGKERTLSEVFGCVGGQVSFFHRKWLIDWQASLGISFVNHHLSLYSMRGERKRDYPANYAYPQPWWEDEKQFSEYTGRVCAAMSAGEQQADILVLQPLSSIWCEYTPFIHNQEAFRLEREYDEPFNMLSAELSALKFNYHYGNENLMAGHGSIAGKEIKIGHCAYRTVVVPPTLNLAARTVELLLSFAAAGGELIFVKALPNHVDGVEHKLSFPGARIALDITEVLKLLDESHADRIRVIDLHRGENAATVYVNSVKSGETTLHFLTNISEQRTFPAEIRLGKYAGLPLAVMDLLTGETCSLRAEGGAIKLQFAPAGSVLLICGAEAVGVKGEAPLFLETGVVFSQLAETEPLAVIEKLKVNVLEENVLLLNNFNLEMNGKAVSDGPICDTWHRHFYPAPEGTPFRATYVFESEIKLKKAFAVIEMAQNLDTILFNGTPVAALRKAGDLSIYDPKECWKELSFTRVVLPGIKAGRNTLVISGRKINNITGPGFHLPVRDFQNHNPTEAEEVYICGNFSLLEKKTGRYVITRSRKPGPVDLTVSGYPFYAGRALFSTYFVLKKKSGRVFLQLRAAKIASARIAVNGKECGTARWEPHLVEITSAVKAGRNLIEIDAATTLVNLLGPNRRSGVKKDVGIGPSSFFDMSRFQERCELFEFGIGSVAILRWDG